MIAKDGRVRLGLAAVFAVAVAVGWLMMDDRESKRRVRDPRKRQAVEQAKPSFPAPGYSESPHASVLAGTGYLGAAACVDCHPQQHASYLLTSHSRALGDVKLADEPPSAEFRHDASDRKYVVHRREGRLWHRELQGEGEREVELADYPMRYVIGSGNHSRSYLVDDQGFLVESPVTWYTAKQAWGMSPGYDRPGHAGFQRAADIGCVVCHAGRVESLQGSRERVKIHESVIGCESCHGPGEAHVKKWSERARAGEPAPTASQASQPSDDAEDDWTIVQPNKLDRLRNEAVCGQCHLRAAATVLLRGRDVTSVRPGRPLTDYRIDYVLQSEGREMKVVGHTEQMRRSKCYQRSETMTCTSCHNPHETPPREQRPAYFIDKCLQCHERGSCHLPSAERVEQNGDNCLACHMPQVPTDIPHFAFTHHRVGIHGSAADGEPADETAGIGTLVPLDDISHLPEIDRQRGLGLAYLELSVQSPPREADAYRKRAAKLLQQVHDQGLRDGEVEQSLARLAWQQDDTAAMSHAIAALDCQPLSPGARVNSLFVLGKIYLKRGEPELAKPLFEQLVQLRRHAHDWQVLAECRTRLGDTAGAEQAAARSREIGGRAE